MGSRILTREQKVIIFTIFIYFLFLLISKYSFAAGPDLESGAQDVHNPYNPLQRVFVEYAEIFLTGARVFAVILMTSGLIALGAQLSDGVSSTTQLNNSFFTIGAAVFIIASTQAINTATGQLAFDGVMDSAMMFIRIAGALMVAWGVVQIGLAVTQMGGVIMFKAFMTIAGGLIVIVASGLLSSLPTLNGAPGAGIENTPWLILPAINYLGGVLL